MVIDLHAHTRFGSNCSYMPPSDLAKRAKEVGLDAVCITEHNLHWNVDDLSALSREHDVLVLGGIEVSTEYGDILVFGMRESVVGVAAVDELRRLVDGAGGVMIAAHPFRKDMFTGHPANVDEIAARPIFQLVDAVEVFNGMSNRKEVALGCEVVRKLGMRGVGGSDTHAVHTVGQCATAFEKEVHDEQDLVAELKAGRFKAVHRLMNLTF